MHVVVHGLLKCSSKFSRKIFDLHLCRAQRELCRCISEMSEKLKTNGILGC
jgi:hypothetical protein